MRVVANIHFDRGQAHLATLAVKSMEGIRYQCYPTLVKIDMECNEEQKKELMERLKRAETYFYVEYVIS